MGDSITITAFEEKVKTKQLCATTVNGKISYGKYEEKICQCSETQTDPLQESENVFVSKQDFEKFLFGFEDFER